MKPPKILTILIILFLLGTIALAAPTTTIKQGTRTITYKNISFQDIATPYDTVRKTNFAEGISPAYSGGTGDTGKVLGLMLTKDSGAISNGIVSTLPESKRQNRPKGITIQKTKAHNAQFEYYPDNAFISAESINIWKTTIKRKDGEATHLKISIGKNAVFEQNGFRIKCKFNSPCMSFNIIEQPNGNTISYLNVFSYAEIYRLKNHNEEKDTRRQINRIAGLRVLKPDRAEMVLVGIPAGTTAGTSSIGDLKFKSKGIMRYEESFNDNKLKVLGTNLALITYPDETEIEVMNTGAKNSYIQAYSNGKPALQLDWGQATLTKTESSYGMCSYRDQNCLFLSGSKIRANLPGNAKAPTIKIIAPSSGYIDLKIDNLGTSTKLYSGRGTAYGSLVFTNQEVNVKGSSSKWQDFHTSFDTILTKDGKKYRLECDAKKGLCKVNGKETLKSPTLRTCSLTSWCDDGEKCVNGICVFNGEGCLPHTLKGSPSSKIDLLVIGDGYESENELKSDITKFLDNGLFAISPFKENSHKFNIHTLIYKPGEIPRTTMAGYSQTASNSEIDSIRAKRCADADYVIVLNPTSHAPYRYPYSGNIYIPSTGIYSTIGRFVISHEFGHAFSNLRDEYYNYIPSGSPSTPTGINCAKDQAEAQRKFGTTSFTGCGGHCLPNFKCESYFKPSAYSIMGKRTPSGPGELDSFNTVSLRALSSDLRRYS